jgi:hypothetical protein
MATCIYHCHLFHSATEHTVVMFTVIVSQQHTLLCDIRHSFPMNCTCSQVLFFQCHSCFISLFLNGQLYVLRICQYSFSSQRSLWLGCCKLYAERYPQCRLLKSRILRTIDHLFRETRTVYPLVGPIEDRRARTVCEE